MKDLEIILKLILIKLEGESNMTRFEKFEERWIIKGKIICETNFAIGSGQYTSSGDPAPIMKTQDDKPYIPGSTLKGATRAASERILNGLGIAICSNKTHADSKLCKSCEIFGAMSYGSKVLFRDSIANKYSTSVKTGIAIDLDTRATKRGAKYDIELVEAGSEFPIEIVFENPKDDEPAILFAALKSIPAIGGHTSRGLGKVKIEIEKIEIYSPKNYFTPIVKPSKIIEKEELSKYITAISKPYIKE